MMNKPPFYKEVLVGLLVGSLLGPLMGWLIGTVATFVAISAMTSGVRGMRGSAFIGGLIGIPVGFVIGLIVSPSLRIVSRKVSFLMNPWFAGLAGTVLGWICAYATVQLWYSTFGSLLYVLMVCMFVGGTTGAVVVIAKPKWL